MKIKKIDVKGLLIKFKQFFKYKGYVERPIENKHKDFLLQQSVDSVGVIDCTENGECRTKSNEIYKIYQLSFLTPNGLDNIIDNDNLDGLIQVMDILECDYKIMFPQIYKYMLSSNIEFYEECLKNEKHEGRRESIIHNIEIMKVFDKRKYVSELIYVNEKDVDKFIRIASNVCEVTEYDQTDCIDLFTRLNNKVE